MVMAFSLLARTLKESLTKFPVCAFFFLKWRSAWMYQFHSSGQDQCTVAQRAEMTVNECSLMSCMWAHFPDRFPHHTWTAQSVHSNSVGSWVYVWLGVTCHLHFWQNDRSLLDAAAIIWVERTLCESQDKELTREKKICPPLLPGLELTGFWSQVQFSTNKLSWLPH